MNTEDMLKELASLLNSFLIHPKFLEELRTLLKTDLKGKESIFFKILTTQLSNIKNFGSKIYTIDSNEILQGADGHYYSIHLQKSQFNVRLHLEVFHCCLSYISLNQSFLYCLIV